MSRGHYISKARNSARNAKRDELVNEVEAKDRVVLNDDARRYAKAERESVPKGRIDTGRGR